MCKYDYWILRKNLDGCFVIIFDQWQLFLLIDLITGGLYEVNQVSSQSTKIIFTIQKYLQNFDQGFSENSDTCIR